MSNLTETQEMLIQAIEQSRDDAQALLDGILPHSNIFIVVCGDLPIRFTARDEHGNYSAPTTTSLSNATRLSGYTRESMARLAAAVKNGEGTPGHIVSLRTACMHHIDTQNELLDTIERRLAGMDQ